MKLTTVVPTIFITLSVVYIVAGIMELEQVMQLIGLLFLVGMIALGCVVSTSPHKEQNG